MIDSLYTLLQLSDSSFPSGAFAHSSGFEGLLAQSGTVTVDELGDFAQALWRQQTLLVDGLLGAAAHRAAQSGDVDGICALDQTLQTLKLCRELREASLRTGRSFLGEAARVVSSPLLASLEAKLASGELAGNYAIVFASVCAAARIETAPSILAWGYQSMAQVTAALLRLGVIGHRGAGVLLTRLRPVVEDGVRAVLATEGLTVSSFAPCLEIASMTHESQYSRLFQS